MPKLYLEAKAFPSFPVKPFSAVPAGGQNDNADKTNRSFIMGASKPSQTWCKRSLVAALFRCTAFHAMATRGT